MNKIDVFFDGACKNVKEANCPMGLGIAVYVDDIYQEELSRAIGVKDHEDPGTSNIGEWLAICNAIELIAELRKTHLDAKVRLFGDSQLIVNQFNLIWQIKKDTFKKYLSRARHADVQAKVGQVYWVPREKNTKADELSKIGLALAKPIQVKIKRSN
jgi:ribonuclease HI